MLDVQRNRISFLREEVHFTRKLLISHLLVAIFIVGLFVAHGVYFWALGATLWYLLTILPIKGMMAASSGCRHVLGLMFLLFSALGVFFLTQVEPTVGQESYNLLPTSILPFWLGALNLLYAIAGVYLMMNRKVRKAVAIGFSLW